MSNDAIGIDTDFASYKDIFFPPGQPDDLTIEPTMDHVFLQPCDVEESEIAMSWMNWFEDRKVPHRAMIDPRGRLVIFKHMVNTGGKCCSNSPFPKGGW